jgi:asparagine synthase (glutamine-hydrolysing)
MVKSMAHENFYLSGMHIVPSLGVYAGWTALENSFAAGQVFQNQAQDITLVFSGECFLPENTRAALKQKGHLLGDDPAGWLVHLYEEGFERFFAGLNGQFSGLLVDQRRNKIFLFNDRFGMERIYWRETAGVFYFASEAKVLLRILPELREFDAEGVAQFLALGSTLGTRTLFRGVDRLPGGSLWTFENGNCHKENYFSPEIWESQPQLTAEEFETNFQATFKKILPRYFSGNSKTGIALTGGLDTRMIMACRPQNNGNQTSYTFAGRHGETLDDEIAARVATACGLDHKLLRLQPDFFSDFAAHADRTVYLTDGSSGILGAHEIYFNRQARALSAVRLTGNFGGEIFRGVSTFKPLRLAPEMINTDFVSAVDSSAFMLAAHKGNPYTFAACKEIPWNIFGTVAAGRSQVTIRTPYLDNELVALAYQTPRGIRKSPLPALHLILANSPALSAIPTDRGFAGNNSGPAFLARRIFAEVTFIMDYYNNEGLPRPLAPFDPAFKFVASKLKLAGLHKYLHYNYWFRHELSGYLRSALAAPQVLENRFWNPDFLKRMAGEHIAGRKNYSMEINAVLTLEAIERLLFRELPRDN